MKKSEQIIHALGLVREEYIEQAAPGRGRKRAVFAVVAAAAACAVLLTVLWPAAPKTPVSSNFPELVFKSACGGKGFWAYNSYEYVTSGPWTEGAELSTLPIYKNLWVRNGAGVPPQMDDGEEEKLVESMRLQFGELGTDSEIQVADGHSARIVFPEPIPVPEEYKLTGSSTYQDAQATARYLLDTYGKYLGIEDPVTDISDGSFNINGERNFEIGFYENGDSLSESVVNACFRRVDFTINEEGDIYAIRFTLTDLSAAVDDYPVITSQQATELLYQGYFITGDSSMTIVPGAKIEKVYLTYPATGMEEYYIPYYVFVVETEERIKQTPGLKVYRNYYVPAVPLEYLQGMNGYTAKIN